MLLFHPPAGILRCSLGWRRGTSTPQRRTIVSAVTQRVLQKNLLRETSIPCRIAVGSTLLFVGIVIHTTREKIQQDSRDHHLHHTQSKTRIRTAPFQRRVSPTRSFGTHVARCSDEEAAGTPEAHRYANSLDYHQSLLYDYERRWAVEKHTPSAATTEIRFLSAWQTDLQYCLRNASNDGNTPCRGTQLRLAVGLVSADSAQQRLHGYHLLRELAVVDDTNEHADPEAMWHYGRYLQQQSSSSSSSEQRQAPLPWFQRAATLGHVDATYDWALLLPEGRDELYVYLLETAAQWGHAGAAYALGCWYCYYPSSTTDTNGSEEATTTTDRSLDRTEALEWWVTAAELGHAVARRRVLGVLRGEEELVPAQEQRREVELATPSILLERRYTMLSRGDDDDDNDDDNEYEVPPTVAVTGDEDVGVMSLERRYTVDRSGEDEEDNEYPNSIERRFTIGPSAGQGKADSDATKQ